MQVQRHHYILEINRLLKESKIVALLGPRQCGKTTLARQIQQEWSNGAVYFFDLEDYRDLNKLENPFLLLEPLEGLIILDEIQLKPDLFPILRVLADQLKDRRFLILGSASQELISNSAETLAGRISFVEITPFVYRNLSETIHQSVEDLWIKGGFPKSLLTRSVKQSLDWRRNYVKTFLERDISRLGFNIPPQTMRQFWMMLSHFHACLMNYSEIGKSMGISDTTCRRYLDILEGTFMVRRLRPWTYNTKKRLVKQPKIYFRDSGIFHFLQFIEDKDQLFGSPKLGCSWEGFALEQVIQMLGLESENCYFWALHSGAEIDLVFPHQNKLWGVEFKFHDAPKKTRSMMSALMELNLEHIWIVYPGKSTYALDERITVLSINELKVTIFDQNNS